MSKTLKKIFFLVHSTSLGLIANIDRHQGAREAAMLHFYSMVPLVTELRASVAMFKRGPGH